MKQLKQCVHYTLKNEKESEKPLISKLEISGFIITFKPLYGQQEQHEAQDLDCYL